jgi:hypothetical protein
MSTTKSPWGPAALAYLIYRRATRRTKQPYSNPARVWLVRLLLVMVTAPIVAPILWNALVTMPPALAVFVGSAFIFRIVRWYWRRGR